MQKFFQFLKILREVGLSGIVDLREQAVRDALTGLFNRRFVQEIKGNVLAQAERYGRGLTIVLFDLDGFKRVNDQHGYEAGDRILKLVAETMLEHSRTADYAIRWGGDEFLLILPETRKEGAIVFIERMAESLRRKGVSLSWGVASWDAKERLTFEVMFEKANELLRGQKILKQARR